MKKVLSLCLSILLFSGNALAVVPQQSLFTDELVHVPSQERLFVDVLVHHVPTDVEKIAAAELLISRENKGIFCQEIIDLHTKGRLIHRNIMPLLESKNIHRSGVTYIGTSLMISAVSMASSMLKRISGKGLAIVDSESNLTKENVTALVNSYRISADNAADSLDKTLITELLKERKNILIQEMYDKMLEQIRKPGLGDIATEDYAMFGVYGLVFLFGARKLQNPYLVGFAQGFGSLLAAVNIHPLLVYRNALRSREQEMNYIDEVIEKIELLDI